MSFRFAITVLSLVFAVAFAGMPRTYSAAKKPFYSRIFNDTDWRRTLYCDCPFDGNRRIEFSQCSRVVDKTLGYIPKSETEPVATSLEHIVPASQWQLNIGGDETLCWYSPGSFRQCRKSNGKIDSGRRCCQKVSVAFNRFEGDLYNLRPEGRWMNSDRGNIPFGEVVGKPVEYKNCQFQFGRNVAGEEVVEPSDELKGYIARVHFYMSETHNLNIVASQRTMLEQWDASKPVDSFECQLYRRIKQVTTVDNPLLKARCEEHGETSTADDAPSALAGEI